MSTISSFFNANSKTLLIILLIITIVVEANPKPKPSMFSKFSTPTTPKHRFHSSIQQTLSQAHSALDTATSVLGQSHLVALSRDAGSLNDCIELLDDTIDQLTNAEKKHHYVYDSDVHTWLSAALTNQETCLESFQNNKEIGVVENGHYMGSLALNLSQSISNLLGLYVTHYKPLKSNSEVSHGGRGRKLLSGNKTFPRWLSESERRLLAAPIGEIEAHAVVAMDGTGTHQSITEALGMVTASTMKNAGGRSVIYVKAGTYHENIKIPTKRKNVLLVGDGKGKTVIVGSRNAEDGWTTFQSATVAAMGDGFMARDITFFNSAGPKKHQAVALRVGSDKAVIYRCSIIGYQDTLYVHSKRQFYRETDIYGTVDFIFGNAAVVFQNCNIYARKPSSSANFVTAQGRTDPNQNTGISIHNCKILVSQDLVGRKITYLGRPWKAYSRTVVMQSFIDGSIHPLGWSPWSGGFGLKTLFYGEYMNYGPGSSTQARVKWPGYHGRMTPVEAQGFTVGGFIAGNAWLPSTGVSFDSGLVR